MVLTVIWFLIDVNTLPKPTGTPLITGTSETLKTFVIFGEEFYNPFSVAFRSVIFHRLFNL